MARATHAAGCPREVLDWIAWYPEGQLPERARGAIEAHAAECARCREELAMLEGRVEPRDPELPDAEVVLARVMARLEGTGAPGRSVSGLSRAPARPRLRGAARRGAAAAALLLVGALAGGLAASWLATDGPDATYRAASGPPPVAPSGSGPALDVVLRDDVSVGALRQTLRELGANVLAGPSAGGVMRIALPTGADVSAAAARLTDTGGVARLAEPVER